MKKCTRCGNEKPLTDFQVRSASNDGYTASCKQCLSDYDKSRANLPHRVKAREKYQKTDEGKAAKAKATIRYKEKNPKKNAAHHAISNAVRDGKIKRHCCLLCGDEKTEAHHTHYDDPLAVIWLCTKHHKQAHAMARELMAHEQNQRNYRRWRPSGNKPSGMQLRV